jgi:hypothetical protein
VCADRLGNTKNLHEQKKAYRWVSALTAK